MSSLGGVGGFDDGALIGSASSRYIPPTSQSLTPSSSVGSSQSPKLLKDRKVTTLKPNQDPSRPEDKKPSNEPTATNMENVAGEAYDTLLPPELWSKIASSIDLKSIAQLARVSRRLHDFSDMMLTSRLVRLGFKHSEVREPNTFLSTLKANLRLLGDSTAISGIEEIIADVQRPSGASTYALRSLLKSLEETKEISTESYKSFFMRQWKRKVKFNREILILKPQTHDERAKLLSELLEDCKLAIQLQDSDMVRSLLIPECFTKFSFDQKLELFVEAQRYNNPNVEPLMFATGLEKEFSTDSKAKLQIISVNDDPSPNDQVLIVRRGNVNPKGEENRTLLHHAARYNQVDVIEELAKRHVDLNVGDSYGLTPLHFAVIFNNQAAIDLLLEHEANINCVDSFGRTPFHYAAMTNKLNLLRSLTLKEAIINLPDVTKMTPVLYVIKYDHLEAIQFFIQHYSSEIKAKDSDGQTLLHHAAKMGSLRALIELIEKGANVHEKDVMNCSPLHFAAFNGHKDIVAALIKRGALVNGSGDGPPTPLQMAVMSGHKNIVVYLIEMGADANVKDLYRKTLLHLAAERGHKDVVIALIKKGADVKIEDIAGKTPLHLAIEKGRKDIVTALIEMGADYHKRTGGNWVLHSGLNSDRVLMFTKSDAGKTPLHYAAEQGNKDIFDALIEKDFDVNEKDIQGNTPLHYAAQKGHKYIFDALIKKGADVNMKNNLGETLLHFAAFYGHQDIVAALIEMGVDFNEKDKRGNTPLHLAVRNGKKDIFDALIKMGGDVNMKNNNGTTLLHFAAQSGKKDIFDALIEMGGDVNMKNNKGTTLLHFAVKSGKKDMVDLVIEKNAKVNARDKNGMTPLHYATRYMPIYRAQFIDKNIIIALIEKGANLHEKDVQGLTPLHHIAGGIRTQIAQMDKDFMIDLIKKHANLNAKDNKGKTSLPEAALWGHNDFIIDLIENGYDDFLKAGVSQMDYDRNMILYDAAKSARNKDVIKVLIEYVADVHAKDENGNNLLHHAAAFAGNENIIAALIEKNVNVNAQNKYGKTPLHLAAANGQRSAVNTLIARGAIVDCLDENKLTPFHMAQVSNHTDIMTILRDNSPTTLLHNAAQSGDWDSIISLVDKGADVNFFSDNNGRTLLHMAVERNKVEAVTLLIQRGANVNARDTDGATPLHLAAAFNYIDIMIILLSKEAQIDAKLPSGETPFDIAFQGNYQEAIQLLIEWPMENKN